MISNVGLQSTCTSILFVLATRSEEEEACDDDEDLLLQLWNYFAMKRWNHLAFLACFYLLCVVAKHNVGTFKQLSSWQDLMSAWKGESLHAQDQSGCLKTGGQKRESTRDSLGTKPWPARDSMDTTRVSTSSGKKVQMKKSPQEKCLCQSASRDWNSFSSSHIGRLNLYCLRE